VDAAEPEDAAPVESGSDVSRMIDNRVVRPQVVETLMQKMARSAASDKIKRAPNNPVTNQFSTYYHRESQKNIGGFLLNAEEIVDGFECLFPDQPNDESSNQNDSANGDEMAGAEDGEGTIRSRMKMRNRQRRDHANSKRAKKYSNPPDELTRLQIREDIRKIRTPQMSDMTEILSFCGLAQYASHEKYLADSNLMNMPTQSLYREADDDEEDGQFIGARAKHKRKRKRKRTAEPALPKLESTPHHSQANQPVFSISNGSNGGPHSMHMGFADVAEPQRKRMKASEDSINLRKCPNCYKEFPLEIDLLMHKIHDCSHK